MKVRRLRADECGRVDEFLREHLYKDEPLGCCVAEDEIPVPGKGFGTALVPQGLSVVAEDESGAIMGVCLNDEWPQQLSYIYSFTDNDVKFQTMFEYAQDVSGVNDVAAGAMELRMLAVNSDYRRQGVASRLIDESVNVARESGFSWCKIYCTSLFSTKMITKKGWTLLYWSSYHSLKKDVVPDLPLPDQPHSDLSLFIKATKD